MEQWVAQKSFFETGSGHLRAMAVGRDGSVTLAGGIVSEATGNDIFVMRYSPLGELVWMDLYNRFGASEEKFSSLSVGEDGDVTLVGIDESGLPRSLIVIRYIADGVKRYSDYSTFEGMDIPGISRVVTDSQNAAFVVGLMVSHPDLTYETFTMKYPENGSCQPPLDCDLDNDCACGLSDLIRLCEQWLR